MAAQLIDYKAKMALALSKISALAASVKNPAVSTGLTQATTQITNNVADNVSNVVTNNVATTTTQSASLSLGQALTNSVKTSSVASSTSQASGATNSVNDAGAVSTSAPAVSATSLLASKLSLNFSNILSKIAVTKITPTPVMPDPDPAPVASTAAKTALASALKAGLASSLTKSVSNPINPINDNSDTSTTGSNSSSSSSKGSSSSSGTSNSSSSSSSSGSNSAANNTPVNPLANEDFDNDDLPYLSEFGDANSPDIYSNDNDFSKYSQDGAKAKASPKLLAKLDLDYMFKTTDSGRHYGPEYENGDPTYDQLMGNDMLTFKLDKAPLGYNFSGIELVSVNAFNTDVKPQFEYQVVRSNGQLYLRIDNDNLSRELYQFQNNLLKFKLTFKNAAGTEVEQDLGLRANGNGAFCSVWRTDDTVTIGNNTEDFVFNIADNDEFWDGWKDDYTIHGIYDVKITTLAGNLIANVGNGEKSYLEYSDDMKSLIVDTTDQALKNILTTRNNEYIITGKYSDNHLSHNPNTTFTITVLDQARYDQTYQVLAEGDSSDLVAQTQNFDTGFIADNFVF